MLKCSAFFALGMVLQWGWCCLLDGDIILVVITPSLGRCQPYILSLLAVHLTAISRSFNRYQPFAEPLLLAHRAAIGIQKKTWR